MPVADKRCKCGTGITFLMGPNGSQIPVQQVRNVYKYDGQLGKLVPIELGAGPTLISHFEACPHAGSFTRGKSKSGRRRT